MQTHVIVEAETNEEYELCLRGMKTDGNYFGDGQTWECIAPVQVPAQYETPPTTTNPATTESLLLLIVFLLRTILRLLSGQ